MSYALRGSIKQRRAEDMISIARGSQGMPWTVGRTATPTTDEGQSERADSNPVSASPAMSSDDPHSHSRQSRDTTEKLPHYELSLPFNF